MGIVDGSIHWNGQDNFVDFIQFAAAKVGMTREEYISHYGRGIDEADKKPGPDPYHRGLEDDEVEDKEDQIKKQAEMDDDDPDAYKEMPGDKEAREKGEVKTSKATKAYNKIYGEDLDEGTMSDIHQMAGEAKSKEDFLKKFFKEYGAKIKKTKDSEEWASSMYDEMDESKVEETQKMTKKEWGHIKKFNKHVTASGEKFVMNYDDRIGTFLEPVEIVDETVTPENPVHEAKAYKLKASEFGADTHSAAYNVKGETTWRVHSTYAIDQVSGENDASERDVVFFEAMPINNDIYIKIGGINNLKRTGSTVGDNFGTTIEEWKKDPKGIAKEASEFLTDATHLKWINKKARSQGQTIKWALKDDYSSVIVDLVNKSLGLTESQVNEFYFENDEEERLQKFVDQLSFGDELEYRDGFSTGRGSFPNTRELKKELDSNFQLLLTQKSGRNWDLYVGSDDLVFLIQPDLGAKNYMQISISSTKEQWNDESSVFARSNGYSVYESLVTEASEDRMIKQIERALKDGTSIFKLPMATQKYYNKNKSDFESAVTEAVSRATKIYQIATPAPKAMLVDELEDLFGDDYRHIVTEFDDDEGYESVLVFNLSKKDVQRIQNEIGDVLIWEYSIKKGKEITESVVTEGLSKEQKMVETFLNKIAKEFDYSIQDAVRFVKETITKMRLDESLVTEEGDRDTLGELNNMTLGQLERIEDYAEMISDRMDAGQQLESWMFSQITVALDNLNAVHDAMDGEDGIKESIVTEGDDTEQKSTDRGPLDDDKIETALKKKAEDTGVPIGIIRAVMRRGLAAWKSGHRPGANQQQWGYARVNAFLTKGEGTWGEADKDLAKEVRDGGHDKKLKKA